MAITLLSNCLIALVAALHFYFMWLEMFAWTTRGQKVFRRSAEYLETTRTLAANQGLYNGFLAAGLVWALLISDPIWSCNVAMFFLGCVVVAGIYGAMTVGKRIFWIQSMPALLALAALFLK